MVVRLPASAFQGTVLVAFCALQYEDVALNELARLLDAGPNARLAPGAWLLSARLLADKAQLRVENSPPIFTRQLIVDVTRVPSTGGAEGDADAALATPAAQNASTVCAFDALRPDRIAPELEALRAAVAARLRGPRDARAHDRPLALVVAGDSLLVGTLLPQAGLPLRSEAPLWPAARPRLPYVPGLVSRSALKLMEALEVFGVDLRRGADALDLGAAPGGWTQVLAGHGLRVVAVDPAVLDPRVASLPRVQVARTTAQDHLRRTDSRFDLIVDDMRQDARDSARIMAGAAAMIRPGGSGLLTLKLPERSPTDHLRPALDILRLPFPRLRARCLYFNRSEVTVYLPTI
jgi:23S rRNA (cytidine2498-2'-O)-methyltransferase